MVRGLRGDGRDEYWARLDVHATALAGHVVIGVSIVMCLWEWAHGAGRLALRRAPGRSPASRTSSPLAALRIRSSSEARDVDPRRPRRQKLAPGALRRVLVVAEADELRAVPEAVRLHLVVAHLDHELRPNRRLLELAAAPAVRLREAALGCVLEERRRASRSRRASRARRPPSRRSRSRRPRRTGRAAAWRSGPAATSSAGRRPRSRRSSPASP